jgi:hypothetical protein
MGSPTILSSQGNFMDTLYASIYLNLYLCKGMYMLYMSNIFIYHYNWKGVKNLYKCTYMYAHEWLMLINSFKPNEFMHIHIDTN